MVHPGAAETQAVRATFFIDPNGVLPAMGCDMIVPPPKTSDAADKRAMEGFNTVDWYSTKKF